MKILFLSQYFPPEMGAPAARVSELSSRWTEAGEEVTVVTAFPNHPNGVIPPEYRGLKYLKESTDGYTVLRSWIYIAANKGFFKRLVCFLSFMASSAFVAIFRAGSCDVVIATSPQIFVGLSGWFVSLVKRRPFVLEVRDLWPDSAIQLGVLRNPILIRLSRLLERFLYRRADLLVPVSESIQEEIARHGIPADRIELVPNGIDPDLFQPSRCDNDQRRSLGIGDAFLVSYIGTHGMSHGLENVVEAAALLKDRKDIHFVFIGDGAHKEKLVALSRDRGVERLHFLPPQPKKEIPLWLAASDACLVSLLDLPVFQTVLPSKMFEIMACERAVLMVGGGECRRLIEQAQAGISVPPGSPRELADAIVGIAEDRHTLHQHGVNGRNYVVRHFNRSELADRYLQKLKETCQS